jgi:hypothetical protein
MTSLYGIWHHNDKEWRINILWFNGSKINQDCKQAINLLILNEISYTL